MTSVWIIAGIIGGAIAGLVDAGIAIAGGIGGMSVAKAIRLVALSASLLAAAGGVAGWSLPRAARWCSGRGTRPAGRVCCGRSRGRRWWSTTRSRCSRGRARRASRRTASSPSA